MGQGYDDSVSRVIMFPLFLEMVAENDRVVDGQRELEHDGDRIGDEGNSPHEEIRAIVDERRSAEGKKEHRHFAEGLGGQDQHRDDHDPHHSDDQFHLFCNGVRLHISEFRGNMKVIGSKRRFQRVQGFQGPVVIIGIPEDHVVQRGGIIVVIPYLFEGKLLVLVRHFRGSRLQIIREEGCLEHARGLLDLFIDLERLGKRDIGYHYFRGSESSVFLFHHIHGLLGLRVIAEVLGKIVLHRYPVGREDREDDQDDVDQEEQVPLVYNKRTYFHKW